MKNMEAVAMQHCTTERELEALKRIKRREAKMLRKEEQEMASEYGFLKITF